MISRLRGLVRSGMVRLHCLAGLATARRDSRASLARPGLRRVLVVCYGNIYRSAFVGAYLALERIPGLEVRSAGFHPEADRQVPARHVEMSRQFGVDLSAHRSAALCGDDIAWAQLIVLMDRHNWRALIERGAARDRLAWLGALDGGALEITDPYRLDDGHARQIVSRLAACSKHLADNLRT